ncbi:MAG TPA: pantoate--beta-alanine ligase [Acidimicrobiia bacterium]
MTELTRTFADTRARYRGKVALVPTMGYFHEGHLALMKAARTAAETVVVSHFVNPLQFNDPSDLASYPRDLDRDLELAAAEKVDLLFSPPLSEMYPREPRTRVIVSGVSDRMEGPRRPRHFEGVATVVAKLFAGLRPEVAFFGRKDAQQLAVVRQLVTDLSFPITISGQPTLREADGLALSSRNVFLASEDRPGALLISKGLFAAADLVEAGQRDGSVIEDAVRHVNESIEVEYIELASQENCERLFELDRPAFLAIAARVGKVRLIDNVHFDLVAGDVMADRGIRLSAMSMLYS